MGTLNRNKLIEFIQSQLNLRYNARLKVDGRIGRKTMDALNRVTSYPSDFSTSRQLVAFVQSLTHKEPAVADIVIDGYWGPRTADAYAKLQRLYTTNQFSSLVAPTSGNPWPKPDLTSMRNFYGEAGTNQIIIDLPFEMRLAWDLKRTVTRTKCHVKVADAMYRVLENIQKEYTLKELQRLKIDYYGGIFNYRTARNSNNLSKHAFGAAIDLCPQFNRLRQTAEKGALFATKDYEPMLQCFVDEHFKSLGVLIDRDWMHFECTS